MVAVLAFFYQLQPYIHSLKRSGFTVGVDNLSPFNFDKNSSMKECKLCMECTHACEANFGKSMVSIEGVMVLILAMILTFTCTVGVYKIASKWLNIPFKTIF